jgi:hypothetical protein
MTSWYDTPDEITKQIVIEISNNIYLGGDQTIIGSRIFYDFDDYKHIAVEVGNGKVTVWRATPEKEKEQTFNLCDPHSIEKVIKKVKFWYKTLELGELEC